jgi:hypothetical protein
MTRYSNVLVETVAAGQGCTANQAVQRPLYVLAEEGQCRVLGVATVTSEPEITTFGTFSFWLRVAFFLCVMIEPVATREEYAAIPTDNVFFLMTAKLTSSGKVYAALEAKEFRT